MYPANVFQLFPPFPRDDRVFVAMPFRGDFVPRYDRIIRPAIEAVGLVPYKVNDSKIGDSIITDISTSIATCRLFLADISEIHRYHWDGRDVIIRNPNVMYEVGLAQAVRLPEEVLLFRADTQDLPFDVAAIRVREYDPNDVDASIKIIKSALADAVREVNTRRSIAITRACERLDGEACAVLAEAVRVKPIEQPVARNIVEAHAYQIRMNAVQKLLDLGAFKSVRLGISSLSPGESLTDKPWSHFFRYEATEFGLAILDSVTMGIFGPPGYRPPPAAADPFGTSSTDAGAT